MSYKSFSYLTSLSHRGPVNSSTLYLSTIKKNFWQICTIRVTNNKFALSDSKDSTENEAEHNSPNVALSVYEEYLRMVVDGTRKDVVFFQKN